MTCCYIYPINIWSDKQIGYSSNSRINKEINVQWDDTNVDYDYDCNDIPYIHVKGNT